MQTEELTILEGCIGAPEGLGPVLPFYQPRQGRDHAPKAQRMINAATVPLVKRYGAYEANKQCVSFHEAGHAVIAHLVGYRVKNVGVYMEVGNQWVGSVIVDDTNSGKPSDLWLRKEALVRIAGYIGERLADRDHPTSSVHEKLHSLVICRYFDDLHGTESGYHFTQALSQCEAALESNREVFEEIGWRLLATNRVGASEINNLMEGAKPLTLSPADAGAKVK
jgi:hypothetical protein